MAKNWTLKEAVQVITEGTDKAAIQELGKKFPITVVAIAKMGANEGIQTIFGAMPEHMTMLKMERALKDGVEDTEEDAVVEAEDSDASEAADTDLSSMTTKQLYNLCIKRGIKANKYGKPKSYYVELLKGGSDQAEAEAEAEDEDEVEEEKESKYGEMSAVELYKLCKKRGIKVEPKQKAAVYVAALEGVDAAAEPEEEDDWGDEEEEKEPKPAKPSKAAKAKKAPADDDDDDWDI